MSETLIGPTSHTYFSQRLRLHYVDWGNEGAPLVLLVHGGRDHCRNWDWVARALRDEYHVIAPDLRGHGDSQWNPSGNYAMVDYVYDVAQLLDQLKLFPISIIGHSLGGSISMQYTGVYPEKVKQLISIEGMGPPPHMIQSRMQQGPQERMRSRISAGRKLAGRVPRRYSSLEEAVKRMQEENPRLTEAQARHLTVHGMDQNEDGTFSWKFDNYVRGHSPYTFNLDEAASLWANITCPTLLVRGTESWASDPAQDGRARRIRDTRVANIEGAGHWVHHDQLEAFLEIATAFLRETSRQR